MGGSHSHKDDPDFCQMTIRKAKIKAVRRALRGGAGGSQVNVRFSAAEGGRAAGGGRGLRRRSPPAESGEPLTAAF